MDTDPYMRKKILLGSGQDKEGTPRDPNGLKRTEVMGKNLKGIIGQK